MIMDVSLISQFSDYPSISFQVDDVPVVVGRSSHANVQVTHPLVSRMHCELCCVDGRLFLKDLASTNQTIVNGQPATETEVYPGDEILIGGVAYRVKLEPQDAMAESLAVR
ncbi:FHA domain-containing protein [Thalassoroseus pseudoceratinae]|uniref:FHA domain-containing protein n=1 Tax=Thalassoroseus pseudoceratinae TaxID=2713176 RepID=UPI00141DD2DA|nr:FHA domain-containing protein [Thalassoroseus pseudoceratinae]